MTLLLVLGWMFTVWLAFNSRGIMVYVWFMASAWFFNKLIHPWLYAQLSELYASIPTP